MTGHCGECGYLLTSPGHGIECGPATVADTQPPSPCGTSYGYQRHMRADTPSCEPCKQARSEYVKRRKAEGAREVAPCGTPAAARRHYRRGERPCSACLEAVNADKRTGDPREASRHGGGGLDPRPVRNGLPEFKPYVYQGLGYDQHERQAGQ